MTRNISAVSGVIFTDIVCITEGVHWNSPGMNAQALSTVIWVVFDCKSNKKVSIIIMGILCNDLTLYAWVAVSGVCARQINPSQLPASVSMLLSPPTSMWAGQNVSALLQAI